MAWPNGVNRAVSEALEVVYRDLGIFTGKYQGDISGYTVQDEFKELVSKWCVENPDQVAKVAKDNNPEKWAVFFRSRFWNDAIRNCERLTESIAYHRRLQDEQEEAWKIMRQQNAELEKTRRVTHRVSDDEACVRIVVFIFMFMAVIIAIAIELSLFS